MDFSLPVYEAPDFTEERFVSAPNVSTAIVQGDGIAPEQFHGTSMFPEYFKIGGEWKLAEESRMDCVPVLEDGRIAVREPRRLKKGDAVVLGRTVRTGSTCTPTASGTSTSRATASPSARAVPARLLSRRIMTPFITY